MRQTAFRSLASLNSDNNDHRPGAIWKHGSFTSVSVTVASDVASFEGTLADVARSATGDYLLFVRPNVRVHRGFDYFLHETFRRHPGVVALTPVFTSGAEPNRAAFAQGPLDSLTPERAAYQFINWHRGESIADFKSPTAPPAIAIRRQVLNRLPSAFFTGLAGLANSGLLKVAPSVACAVMPGAAIRDAAAYLQAPPATRHGAPSLTSPLTTERSCTASFVGRHIKRDRVTLPKHVDADVLAQVIRLTNPGERMADAEPDPPVIAVRRESVGALGAGARATVVLDALAAV